MNLNRVGLPTDDDAHFAYCGVTLCGTFTSMGQEPPPDDAPLCEMCITSGKRKYKQLLDEAFPSKEKVE